ncbi:hypothetical protein DICPUDRAFT_78418 [Dictyostelium purpureum]|uniref:Uncharacterized protein n=1 Tax=Dictyostelium purpureum TaxID=5786 RepID=F0ZJH7_DICPU|nr:uncharacterized protein DICPUDRAFT_78418 [Dictyostelium purpureum]EGC35903.1 hypothetical protein DICPUDRAFT_78418 [Dictyostelium purpureum]|eukprot:XP_003287557.1 hypothetical protein DICPUDRAFT_78418 [Dictyostelium purpureum]
MSVVFLVYVVVMQSLSSNIRVESVSPSCSLKLCSLFHYVFGYLQFISLDFFDNKPLKLILQTVITDFSNISLEENDLIKDLTNKSIFDGSLTDCGKPALD